MFIRSLALCATLLATGCIAVPVDGGYGGGYYGDGGGYSYPAYSYPSYSGTIVYNDYDHRSGSYHRRYDSHYDRHRHHDDRDHRDRGRGWD